MDSRLWIQSRRFDLGFFILSGLASLLLIIPYLLWNKASIWPCNFLYILVFGFPHNYLTWATLLPGSATKTFRMERIKMAVVVCVIICVLIPFSFGTSFGDWVLSCIAYFSIWHGYRQHHGICKVYDSVQAKRTGDTTIFKDRAALNLSFGFAVSLIFVWGFTHPRIDNRISPETSHILIHPLIPWNVFLIYCATTAMMGIYGLKRAVWDRYRQGKFIPWPQLSLIMVAIMTYIVPYCFMGLDAMPIPAAITTVFHNVQYFGFVWAFEKYRSREMQSAQETLGLPQKLALNGSWIKYGGLALAYSVSIIGIYFVLPTLYGFALTYSIALAHYIIDGYIWRSDTNLLLPKVIDCWAA